MAKKRMNLNRVPTPKQPPKERIYNFNEVSLGYNDEQAKKEAERCLACKKPGCVSMCPISVDIPGFVAAIKDGDFSRAIEILKTENRLPGVTGRVCPKEVQCQHGCILEKKKEGSSIAIGALERFVADWDLMQGNRQIPTVEPTNKSVAVVGSGPAGLACAALLASKGHKVTIFEALHTPGGVLVYGIPEFRLPKEIVKSEVDYIRSLGVDVRMDAVVGRLQQVDELLDEYDAVFLGIGAGAPIFLNVPGENLSGIYFANEYLTRINLMKAYRFPDYDTPIMAGKRVAVVGGGNVAMDSARCALRISGSEMVYVIYRRSEDEMPANKEEIENAKEEGIIFKFLTTPVRFIGDERGRLKAVECIEMELGEPDSSGRRRPIPKKGSEHVIDIDVAILALGTKPNPLIPMNTPGLETTKYGTIKANKNGRTTKEGVWAGGDIVTGGATVISAIAAGRLSATDIDSWLKLNGTRNWLTEEIIDCK
jgi:glutamate synthase (NADPH/NADH) small chain